jgi:hypothetical protein
MPVIKRPTCKREYGTIVFFFYYKNLGWENGAPVQNREDLRVQTTLTKVITFTSLQRH